MPDCPSSGLLATVSPARPAGSLSSYSDTFENNSSRGSTTFSATLAVNTVNPASAGSRPDSRAVLPGAANWIGARPTSAPDAS